MEATIGYKHIINLFRSTPDKDIIKAWDNANKKKQKRKEKIKRMNKRQAKKIRKNMLKNGYTILQSNEVNGGRNIYLKFNAFFNKEDDIKNHRIYPLHFVKKMY